MKKKLLLLTAIFSSVALFSQHEADKWYFGVLAGIDFSSGSPVALYGGQINAPGGCSAISDPITGNLSFYTDGQNVWNNNHVQMPNGNGLMAATSSTQAALIVPQPGSSALYSIFTTDGMGGANGFRYSIVDMSLQGGLGDVTATKNILLLDSVTEKLTAVKDPGSNDYWVAVHKWGTNAFYAYRLSATGISAPVISNVGSVHSTSAIQNTQGQMKFNGCGTKIACAVGYQNIVEVFDFNTNTGVVSNPITLSMPDHVYGIEFAPNGSLFYVGCASSQTLVQFDISSGNQATIAASSVSLSLTPDIYGIQLANDGKIYVVKSFSQYLGVINAPNVAGASCNYVDMGFDLDPSFNGVTASLGTPNFVQSFLNNGTGCVSLSIGETQAQSSFSVFPNPSNRNFNLVLNENCSSVEVFDYSGKTIERFSKQKQGDNLKFGGNYADGIYIVKIISADKISMTKVLKSGN